MQSDSEAGLGARVVKTAKKKEENPMQLLNTDYGYVMEMTFFNKQEKKQNAMKVIALDEKVRMINMSLFNIQKL